MFSGKAFLDYCERKVRKGYYAKRNDPDRQPAVDFFYYLWCGKNSPLFGKDEITTFERYFLGDSDKLNLIFFKGVALWTKGYFWN